jgi:hypothetical protein
MTNQEAIKLLINIKERCIDSGDAVFDSKRKEPDDASYQTKAYFLLPGLVRLSISD